MHSSFYTALIRPGKKKPPVLYFSIISGQFSICCFPHCQTLLLAAALPNFASGCCELRSAADYP